MTLKTRLGTPRRARATASAFQKPVAASTLPAASEETALKPIVTRRTWAGSPPSARSSESTTASSEGSPVTPTVRPSRSRGRRTGPLRGAISAASGRWTIAIVADDVEALLAGDPEVVDVEDREVDAAGGEQFRHRAGVAGLADLEVDAGVVVVAAALAPRRSRQWTALGVKSSTSVAPCGAPGSAPSPAAGGAGERQDGRQQRDNRSHFAGKPIWFANPVRLPRANPLGIKGKRRGYPVQERGLAAYLAELIGTFLLVFFIASVVMLFVATGSQAQFGSDFAVVGLVHAFLLFGLIVMFGVVSGGHFNPAVTLAAAAIKRINPIDAAIYMLAQLSGGVLGALLAKALLIDEGRATALRRGPGQRPARRQLRGRDRRGDRHLPAWCW